MHRNSVLARFEYETKTTRVAYRQSIRRFGCVTLAVYFHKKHMTLSGIACREDCRQSGYATKALQMLTDIADKYQLPLRLTPSQLEYTPKALAQSALEAWYERHGFRFENDDVMERQPDAIF